MSLLLLSLEEARPTPARGGDVKAARAAGTAEGRLALTSTSTRASSPFLEREPLPVGIGLGSGIGIGLGVGVGVGLGIGIGVGIGVGLPRLNRRAPTHVQIGVLCAPCI